MNDFKIILPYGYGGGLIYIFIRSEQKYYKWTGADFRPVRKKDKQIINELNQRITKGQPI